MCVVGSYSPSPSSYKRYKRDYSYRHPRPPSPTRRLPFKKARTIDRILSKIASDLVIERGTIDVKSLLSFVKLPFWVLPSFKVVLSLI